MTDDLPAWPEYTTEWVARLSDHNPVPGVIVRSRDEHGPFTIALARGLTKRLVQQGYDELRKAEVDRGGM